LGAAHAVFYRQVLNGLQKQRHTVHFVEFRLQPADYIGGADFALRQRLQIDLDAGRY